MINLVGLCLQKDTSADLETFFDSFFLFWLEANLVLQDTIERVYVGDCYGDVPRGIFIIRGENVVLLGEVVNFHLFISAFHFIFLASHRVHLFAGS